MAAICRDPLVLLLEMASGTLVDVDISVNIRYGYDIRGEVVAENGTAALGESSPVRVRRDGLASDRVPADWAGAVQPRVRRRTAGVGGRGDDRRAPRPERLGGLRRRPRLGRRPRGDAHGEPDAFAAPSARPGLYGA